jgi:hypothetical protein
MDELIERMHAERRDGAVSELFDDWSDIDIVLGGISSP